VLAMLRKLGKKTAFIGKVGNDYLGRHLKKVVEEVGIDTRNLLLDEDVHTTLAFVHTYADGDRDFSFYRNPGADMNLRPEEIDTDLIAQSEVFHFGSLSLTHPGVRKATVKALEAARENGCLITYDPNLRPPLWRDLEEAREQIAFGMRWCDVMKISDNEIQWFTGKEDFDEGIQILQDTYHIPLILLSLGKDGSRAYYQGIKVEAKPFLQKNTIETTGAGDTFCACVINYVLEHGLQNLTEENLLEMLTFANAAASLITTRKGALRVMPEKTDVEALIADKHTKL
jgi:fructokinase